jgi:hypothetical protein
MIRLSSTRCTRPKSEIRIVAVDFGDINPFVALMTSGQGPCP